MIEYWLVEEWLHPVQVICELFFTGEVRVVGLVQAHFQQQRTFRLLPVVVGVGEILLDEVERARQRVLILDNVGRVADARPQHLFRVAPFDGG